MRLLVCSLAIVAAVAVSSDAWACAPVFGAGKTVEVASEEALIVWKSSDRIEHFIRRADFRMRQAAEFGFFVPTPSEPTIAEADDRVFRRLAQIYAPPPPATRGGAGNGMRAASRGEDSFVEVVSVTRVAGLEATVLRASDGPALTRWLTDKGFEVREALTAWLDRYARQRWYITAFRYDPGQARSLAVRAVRMSFQTDHPVFPYSEPADAPRRGRRLFRVTVVTDAQVHGELQERVEGAGTEPRVDRWRARRIYRGQPRRLERAVEGALPTGTSVAGMWMQTFEERASVRGDRDLYFVPDA